MKPQSDHYKVHPRPQQPMVSIVATFFNEEQVLPELVHRLRQVLETLKINNFISGHELVLVNDASTDSSFELLMREAQGHNDIKVINMSRNFGISPCLMAGFQFAKGDCVIYMDADLQDPPELIPTLIETWKQDAEAEVVYTTRRTRAGEHFMKMWLTRLGYKILKHVSEVPSPENSGDFKLLSRRVVNELIHLHEDKPFIRGLVSWIGFKQVQVFYDRDARFSGTTKYPIYSKRVINNFLDSALISFSDVPLKIALFTGFFVSIGAFLWLVGIFVLKFLGLTLGGWAAMMATMVVLGGVQLLTIGVLGLYINAIYRECRGRPKFIIEDSFGFESEPISYTHEYKQTKPNA